MHTHMHTHAVSREEAETKRQKDWKNEFENTQLDPRIWWKQTSLKVSHDAPGIRRFWKPNRGKQLFYWVFSATDIVV